MLQIIVNPASKSGKGIHIWHEVELQLKEKGIHYQVHLTKFQGDATDTARLCTLDLKVPITIVVLGGDGTLNEVIQGICNFDYVTIGYIPTGSSNDFARSLGMPKKRPEILDHIINETNIKHIDIGLADYANHKRCFAVSSGVGFDAAVCAQANASTLKNKLNKLGLGKLTYLGIALHLLIHEKPVGCNLYLDDLEPIYLPRFLFIASMVQRYEGGGFLFCPDADNTDSMLDICCVGGIPFLKELCILPSAFFGKHVNFKGVNIYRAKTVRIVTESPLYIHTDGEVEAKTMEAVMTCLPQKLKFIC